MGPRVFVLLAFGAAVLMSAGTLIYYFTYTESHPPVAVPIEHNPYKCSVEQNVTKSGKRSSSWVCNDPDEHEYTEPYTYVYAPELQHEDLQQKMDYQERQQLMMCNDEKSLRAFVYTCSGDDCPGISTAGTEGLLLTYLMSVLTKRAFLVHTPDWLKLDDYLTPGVKNVKKAGKRYIKSGVEWRIDRCGAALAKKALHKALENPIDLRLPHKEKCPNVHKVLEEELAFIALRAEDFEQDCAYHLLETFKLKMPKWRFEPIYSRLFQKLFNFSASVQKSGKEFMQKNGYKMDHSTICFHVETRSVPGRSGGARHRNVDDFWRCGRWIERGADKGNEMHSSEYVEVPEKHDDYVWVVKSDNEAVVESASGWIKRRNIYRQVISTVEAGYVEDSPSTRHIQMQHLFTELYLLSKCRRFVGSNSARSMMAASLYPDWIEKFYVQVTMEENNHGRPLSEVCKRQRGGWGADLYEQTSFHA
eukprot:scpid47217/ scgid21747/ 